MAQQSQQIRVTITDPTHTRKNTVELPSGVPMSQLIPALITKMNLPVSQGGQPLKYEFDHKTSGKRLKETDTLASAGVQDGDTLILLPTIIAGSSDPRSRRLASDYRRLQELVNNSSLIHIVSTNGNPPEKYILELTCKGIVRVNGDQPDIQEKHRVAIVFPGGYPSEPPAVHMQTSIFHPNISSSSKAVCIGKWYAGQWLDELVFRLVEMVQYKVPPTNDTGRDVLNAEASSWLNRNRHRLPIDGRDVRKPQPQKPRLDFEINILDEDDTSREPSDDLVSQIKIL